MQILSSLRSPQLLKIFTGIVFLLLISHIDQCSFNTLNKNLLQIKRTTRHEESEFLWKEPLHTCCISVLHDGSNLLPSPWSNFKLFTLVQYLNDLFSAAVSSTTLYHVALCTLFIKYQPGKTNPHFLALMSPDKTSCNSQIQSSNAWK